MISTNELVFSVRSVWHTFLRFLPRNKPIKFNYTRNEMSYLIDKVACQTHLLRALSVDWQIYQKKKLSPFYIQANVHINISILVLISFVSTLILINVKTSISICKSSFFFFSSLIFDFEKGQRTSLHFIWLKLNSRQRKQKLACKALM